MQPSSCDSATSDGQARGRPRMATVFGAAFLAGAVAAFGINRALDVHLAQARPQVECEPIFVALRSLPQGSPITVWDVALRDWPKAMLPSTALRAEDSFEGMLLRYPLREGQPLVAAQLVKAAETGFPERMVGAPAWPERPAPAAEPWTPARHVPNPAVDAVHDAAATPAAAAAPESSVAAAAPLAEQPAAAPLTEQPAAAPATDAGSIAVNTPAAPTAADPHVPAPAAGGTTPGEPESHEPVESDAVASIPAGPTEPAVLAAVAAGATSAPDAAVAEPAADVDDRVADLPPIDASVATVTDVVADLPPVQQPDGPTPAEPLPAPPASTAAAPMPLAAPVPTSPATDIEMPLASITATRPQPAARESSVLSRGDAATPSPAAAAAPTLRYLVVPERIALQADASFVSPPPNGERGSMASGRDASNRPRPQARGPAKPARAGGPTTPDGQRRPVTSSPRQGDRGRADAAAKASGGWLPKLGFGGFGNGTPRSQPAGPAAVR